MKEVITEAGTVDEAVRQALEKLGVGADTDRQRIEIEILEEGSRGFLGLIGGKNCRVKVSLKDDPEDVIRGTVEEVIRAMGLNVQFNLTRDNAYWRVSFEGEDVRILIGRHGETINALQFILNLIINRKLEERLHLIVDAEGYRERREATLRRLARRMAERVIRSGKSLALEPMPPQERRIIHLELQDEAGIYTVSRGEEPYRRVVIGLKK